MGNVQGEARFAKIKRLKMDDEVLKRSTFEQWLFTWNMLSRYDQLAKQSTGSPSDQARLRAMLTQTMSDSSAFAKSPQLRAAATKVNVTFRHKVLFRNLEALFRITLSKDPERRDLGTTLLLLQGNVSTISR
jgi:hypothetical protein